jgi:hypothetical protein
MGTGSINCYEGLLSVEAAAQDIAAAAGADDHGGGEQFWGVSAGLWPHFCALAGFQHRAYLHVSGPPLLPFACIDQHVAKNAMVHQLNRFIC